MADAAPPAGDAAIRVPLGRMGRGMGASTPEIRGRTKAPPPVAALPPIEMDALFAAGRTDSKMAIRKARADRSKSSEHVMLSDRARRMTQAVGLELDIAAYDVPEDPPRSLSDDQEYAVALNFLLAAMEKKRKQALSPSDSEEDACGGVEDADAAEAAGSGGGARGRLRGAVSADVLLSGGSSPGAVGAGGGGSGVGGSRSFTPPVSRASHSSAALSRSRSSTGLGGGGSASKARKKENRKTLSSLLKLNKDKEKERSVSSSGISLSEPPKYFVEYLQGSMDTNAVPVLISLNCCLESQGSKWVAKFMALKPMDLLWKLLQPPSGARIPGVSEVMCSAVDVILALSHSPTCIPAIVADDGIQHIVRLLPVNATVSQCAARALHEFLKVDSMVKHVLKAFEVVSPPKPRAGAQVDGSGVFTPIGQAFAIEAAYTHRIHLLTFVNSLIARVDGIGRVALLFDLLSQGLANLLLDCFEVDSPVLRIQSDLLEENIRKEAQRLWDAVPKGGLCAKPGEDPRYSDSSRVLQLTNPYVAAPTLYIPYEGVKVAAAIEVCVAAYSLASTLFKQPRPLVSKYGLYSPSQQRWLLPSDTVRGKGMVAAHFKALPWQLRVRHYVQTEMVHSVHVCPQVTVDTIARSMMEKMVAEGGAEVSEELEYGLYVDLRKQWLDGPDLQAHPEFEHANNSPIVRIRIKPYQLKCVFQQQQIEVSLTDEHTVGQCIGELGKKLAIADEAMERYGLYVRELMDDTDPMVGLLENSALIGSLRKQFGLSEVFLLQLRPEDVTVTCTRGFLRACAAPRAPAEDAAAGCDSGAGEAGEAATGDGGGAAEAAETAAEGGEAKAAGPVRPEGMSDEMWELQKLEMEFSALEDMLEEGNFGIDPCSGGTQSDGDGGKGAEPGSDAGAGEKAVASADADAGGESEAKEGADGADASEGEKKGAESEQGAESEAGEDDEQVVEETVKLFLRGPLTDSAAVIGHVLGIDANSFFIHMLHDDGSSTAALPWSSLAEQGVESGARLKLVAKTEADEVEAEETVNIWDEETSDENFSAKTLEDGKLEVMSGSLNELVKHLTNPVKYDSKFLNTFILTYRSFTSPEMLFRKLMERYRVPDRVDDKEKSVVQMRVLVVLKLWIQRFNSDKERQLFGQITEFIEESKDQALKKTVEKEKKKKARQYYFNEPAPPPILPKAAKPSLMNLDPLEIARQLTLIEFDMFARITPIEFFKQAWCSKKLEHLAPNVLDIIGHFNKISRWVSSRIVIEKQVRKRAKVVEQFIFIAEQCKKLNSFHLLIALISGLNNSSILRLKWTKARLSKRALQVLEDLEEFTNMEGSYRNYRNAVQSSKPPCIPYMGVYLQDLTFIEDGNPDIVNGMINFAKRGMVFKILDQISTFQQDAYNLEVVDDIRYYLSHLPQLQDDDLYRMSLACEPRGASPKDIM